MYNRLFIGIASCLIIKNTAVESLLRMVFESELARLFNSAVFRQPDFASAGHFNLPTTLITNWQELFHIRPQQPPRPNGEIPPRKNSPPKITGLSTPEINFQKRFFPVPKPLFTSFNSFYSPYYYDYYFNYYCFCFNFNIFIIETDLNPKSRTAVIT